MKNPNLEDVNVLMDNVKVRQVGRQVVMTWTQRGENQIAWASSLHSVMRVAMARNRAGVCK